MKVRVLFLSGRETNYIRNRVLLAALRQHFDVTVLTVKSGRILTRSLAGLLRWIVLRPSYDAIIAGFYGQLIALILAAVQRKPVILDAFVSTYDTLCEDRQVFHSQSLLGRLAYWIDRKSFEMAACVLTDTRANARYFSQRFGIPEEKFRVIYVGCDESLFYPRPQQMPSTSRCKVFYYGSFLPLHGTEVIIHAAHLLRDRQDIEFTLGGDGPRFQAVHRMVKEWNLENVRLIGWIPLQRLPVHIAEAVICLGGHFSTIPKAARVIATKTFQFLAMRKPTIVGDNEATSELFTHGEHVYAIPMGDAVALADAIHELSVNNHFRERIAEGGYDVFQAQLTVHAIGTHLKSLIEEVLCESVL